MLNKKTQTYVYTTCGLAFGGKKTRCKNFTLRIVITDPKKNSRKRKVKTK